MTSKEIAIIAGVSRGTVDRALHGRDGVKPEVREKILEIAKRERYIPDRAGKALSLRKKATKIGVVFHNNNNPFFEPVINGIKKAEMDFADFSLNVIRKETKSYSVEEQQKKINELIKEGISALILVPINSPEISQTINHLSENSIPVVCLNSDMESTKRLCYVGCDYIQSGKIAGQMAGLLTGDKAKTAIITGSGNILGHIQRIEGFLEASRTFPNISLCDVAENNDSDLLSYDKVKNILKTEKPDLLFFAAGGVEGGLKAVKEQEKKPLIIACDETAVTKKALEEGLIQAIISQQPYEQGYRSVTVAFDAAVNKKLPVRDKFYTQNRLIIKYCE